MVLKIKVDEDLPDIIAEMARQSGYDAVTVLDQAMGGFKDPALWKVVQSEGRYLIAADKGFGDIRVSSREPQGSVVATTRSGWHPTPRRPFSPCLGATTLRKAYRDLSHCDCSWFTYSKGLR